MTEHAHEHSNGAGSAPDGGPQGLRIGDAEREQAARRLGEHFAAGRLDEQEHSERTTAAYAARTQEQLDALFADLPGEAESAPDQDTPATPDPWRCGPQAWARRGGIGRGGPPRWLPIALIAVALAGAGCAVSHGKPPIMLLPLLVLAGILFARGRRIDWARHGGERR